MGRKPIIYHNLLTVIYNATYLSRCTLDLLPFHPQRVLKNLTALQHDNLVRQIGNGKDKCFSLTTKGYERLYEYNQIRYPPVCSDYHYQQPERAARLGDVVTALLLNGYGGTQ